MKNDDDGIAWVYLFIAIVFFSSLFAIEPPAKDLKPEPKNQKTETRESRPAKSEKRIKLPDYRLEQIALLTEEGVPINVLSARYLEELEKICERQDLFEAGKHECRWRIEQLKIGREDITSRINPLYGRPVFSQNEQNYLRYHEGRLAEMLKIFEYWFLGTKILYSNYCYDQYYVYSSHELLVL